MRKNNTAIIFGSLFFSCSVMAANGTLAPTVVPMVNGGQASIAISNTSPNLFTGHCCKVSDEAAFCLIQRPYISKTLLT
ncbi:hypothetical protein ABEK18_26950, partial [Klebsiella pneumoniae]|nr:hypothetical protein [Klebsiella pneumoniae]